MKIFLLILATVISFNVNANENNFKSAVLKGYRDRCIEVLTGKGYKPETVKLECECEAGYLDRNFNTFQLMIAGAKAATGNKPLSEEEIKKLKSLIAQCKVKFLKK